MRVLYVSKALVAAAYRDKIRELGRRVDVRAVVPDRWGPEPVEPSPEGVPEPRRVPVRLPGHNHLHVYRRAAHWLDEHAPDLVHVDEEPYSLVTLQLGRLCRRRGIPWLFFTWQNLDKRLPPPFGAVRASAFRGARGAVAGTAAAAAALRNAGYRGPVAVIPQFGVCPRRFAPDPEARRRVRERLGVPADAFVAGYGGRLLPEKGVGDLLEAFARLPAERGEEGPESRLLVFGDGPERSRLEAAAARRGLGSRVHFAGAVPSLDVPAHLAALDVLVLPTLGTPSWTEQFGRILVEAMACGVPVVGTRCGEIPEVVGDAGDLVPSGDPEALAAALGRLRAEPGLRARRARDGRARVLERFTQERVAERTAGFYGELVEAPA